MEPHRGEQEPGTSTSPNGVRRPAQQSSCLGGGSGDLESRLVTATAHNPSGPLSSTFSTSCLAIYSLLSENSFYSCFWAGRVGKIKARQTPPYTQQALGGNITPARPASAGRPDGAHRLPDSGRRCPRRGQRPNAQPDLNRGCWKSVTPEEPRSPPRAPPHSGETRRRGQWENSCTFKLFGPQIKKTFACWSCLHVWLFLG